LRKRGCRKLPCDMHTRILGRADLMRLCCLLVVTLFLSACADGGCTSDADCVPAECCHPTSCVPAEGAPDCTGILCTAECAPDTMDCGQGSCRCIEGACQAVLQ
jgi:hypothetical protein